MRGARGLALARLRDAAAQHQPPAGQQAERAGQLEPEAEPGWASARSYVWPISPDSLSEGRSIDEHDRQRDRAERGHRERRRARAADDRAVAHRQRREADDEQRVAVVGAARGAAAGRHGGDRHDLADGQELAHDQRQRGDDEARQRPVARDRGGDGRGRPGEGELSVPRAERSPPGARRHRPSRQAAPRGADYRVAQGLPCLRPQGQTRREAGTQSPRSPPGDGSAAGLPAQRAGSDAMPSALHTTLLIAIAALLVAGGGVAQAADTPFTVRYAETMRGDVLVGRQHLDVLPRRGRHLHRGAQPRRAYSNNDFSDGQRRHRRRRRRRSTPRSATVALPAGATLAWAGLYWAADTTAGAAAPPRRRPPAAARSASRSAPAATRPSPPAELLTSTPQPTRFRGFANITGLLAATGTQTVTVANIQAGRGTDRFGGWALLVAYGDATLPIRRVNVYDGLGTVDATHTFSTTIAPFQTPATGDRHLAARPRRLRGRRRLRHRAGHVQRRRAHRRAEPGQQLHELDDRVATASTSRRRTPTTATSSASTSTRAAAPARWPTARARRRWRSRRRRTTSCRRRSSSSPTRARRSTRAARRSAASPATARR